MTDEIVRLKAEIFDLQVEYCEAKKRTELVRNTIDEKLKHLNNLVDKNAKSG